MQKNMINRCTNTYNQGKKRLSENEKMETTKSIRGRVEKYLEQSWKNINYGWRNEWDRLHISLDSHRYPYYPLKWRETTKSSTDIRSHFTHFIVQHKHTIVDCVFRVLATWLCGYHLWSNVTPNRYICVNVTSFWQYIAYMHVCTNKFRHLYFVLSKANEYRINK